MHKTLQTSLRFLKWGSKLASAQVVLVSRYWTWLFVVFVLLSYWLVFPFEVRVFRT